MKPKRKRDIWLVLGLVLLVLFAIFFIYPCVRLLWEAFYTEKTGLTLKAFTKFFSKK